MTTIDSTEQRRDLAETAWRSNLHHIPRPSRYDEGDTLDLAIEGVCPATKGNACFEIERFIGGGFAGQVYRVRLTSLELDGEPIGGLEVGGLYAIKIIIPPSAFSVAFRNAIYWMAYQGPFSAQTNYAAARTGVLWQKLFRRGARIRFGDERAIVDTYATFFDDGLGSYGEVNEWVEGRVWKMEIDDCVLSRGKAKDGDIEQSVEYLAKKRFMADMVSLCHEMGAPEFARQYEWMTCKSQPNVLKRSVEGGDEDPSKGLTAIDFRAGLALLACLPMSPGDIPLIFKGLGRGAFVQFDRGNFNKLREFIVNHADDYEDLKPAIRELRQSDPAYRASLLDFTYHGFRPLWDAKLRASIREGNIEAWRIRKFADDESAETFRASTPKYLMFLMIGFLPFIGRFIRKMWGNAAYRLHVSSLLGNEEYLRRALDARMAQTLIGWLRSEKVSEERVEAYLRRPGYFWFHRFIPGALPLPASWFRFVTDWGHAWTSMKDTVLYPIRFYRNAEFREEWLRAEIDAGAEEGMLTAEEHEAILARVSDPFIQKYLKCVAVHICTLPITQVISVAVAIWAFLYLGDSWEESMAYAAGVFLVFQALPFSPGSLVRGTYVVYLMIKERNVRNYWLACLVSFWHYVGYLGFPLQMVAEFPALSRFMAGRWATKMVRIIPVFGEHGALPEHWVFDMFFNLPLTIKRRFSERRRRKQNI